MKLIFALLLLALSAQLLFVDAAQLLNRQRRRIDQLGHMISATTGHHYAAYIGYGNYCGPGGAGVPVDNLDACCQVHDYCYDDLMEKKNAGKCGSGSGPVFNQYLSRFNYKEKSNGQLECLDDRSTDYSNCLYELCQCDKVFADCLRPIKDQYNIENLKESQKYLRSLVLLIETAPSVADWVWRIVESLLAA
ncbi:hypothetical protein BOX15_Mlig022217g2 [Macrostomum lignano]|nr:hypothetical protein BOX15_Mlig022217g1 [Macrostomum lignano]PAA89905.1 hypothetical protein BOX15_Mlig022217g2 [Macrostomum lignano]